MSGPPRERRTADPPEATAALRLVYARLIERGRARLKPSRAGFPADPATTPAETSSPTSSGGEEEAPKRRKESDDRPI
jgi:hypothetical protein